MADVVYMVRHAAPPEASRGRFWGHGDPGVDAADLGGVPALVPLAWEKPRRVLSSPLRRAALTATALSAGLALEVEFCPELSEADFGVFDGLTFAEIERRHPDAAREWCAAGDGFAFPGGESVPQFLARASRSWERCVAMPEPSVLVVSHGGVISAWMCLFLGLGFERRFSFRPGYAALTAFVRNKDGGVWDMAFFNNRA